MLLVTLAFRLCAQQNEVDRKQFDEIKTKAEKGDAEAQYKVGLCYHTENQATNDNVEAVKWFRRAAEQGFAPAQVGLGVSLADGDGAIKDASEAVTWFRKAAAQGDENAQFYLGFAYFRGDGVGKDSMEAAKRFREAAELGLGRAQSYLALCYSAGEGVRKDYVEAYKWANLALGQGDQRAKELLATLEEMMTPEACAEYIYKAIVKRKRTLILTPIGKITVILNKLFPGFMDRMTLNFLKKEEDSPFK